MVIVGEWHRVQGSGGPAPMSAFLVVVTASIDILSQVVHLLIPVEVPVSTRTETRLEMGNITTRKCYNERYHLYRTLTTLFIHKEQINS